MCQRGGCFDVHETACVLTGRVFAKTLQALATQPEFIDDGDMREL